MRFTLGATTLGKDVKSANKITNFCEQWTVNVMNLALKPIGTRVCVWRHRDAKRESWLLLPEGVGRLLRF